MSNQQEEATWQKKLPRPISAIIEACALCLYIFLFAVSIILKHKAESSDTETETPPKKNVIKKLIKIIRSACNWIYIIVKTGIYCGLWLISKKDKPFLASVDIKTADVLIVKDAETTKEFENRLKSDK